LHTQTALAQGIVDHGGDDLLCVKGHQGRLYAELAAYFADPHATARTVTTVDRQRGRTATRTLQASTRRNAYLARYGAFPQLGHVIRLLRTVRDRTGLPTEIVSVITSLTPRRADPARLLALIRGHWSVERRHGVRDVTFGADRSRLRTGQAPQIMAAFRNLAQTLIRRSGSTEIAAQRRAFAARPAAALRLLLPKTRSR
jgi:hypothetical protein